MPFGAIVTGGYLDPTNAYGHDGQSPECEPTKPPK